MKCNKLMQFNRFTFGLLEVVNRYIEEDKQVTADTKIKELYDEDFDDFIWVLCCIEIELLYGIDIPEEIATNMNLTLLELSIQLNNLPVVQDGYQQFYIYKTTNLRDRILTYMAQFEIEDGNYLGIGLIDSWVNYVKKKN